MEIYKEACVRGSGVPDEAALEEIHRLTKRRFEAEELYCFTVKLCDNEIDRDFERFAERTLFELAELFAGKSGIFDHNWSAEGQTARLYRTEVVRETQVKTAAGDDYVYLKGSAYMLRNEKNRELIEEIEAGIKKEVSVSCAVAESRCSVCGEPIGHCSHLRGHEYEGGLCYAELIGATDAYEWSFVAVPAQREAGVMKRLGRKGTLQDFLKSKEAEPAWLAEYEQLASMAQTGRRRMAELRQEVVRLGMLADDETDGGLLKSMVEKLDENELVGLRESYSKKLDRRFPPAVQLGMAHESACFETETEFMI